MAKKIKIEQEKKKNKWSLISTTEQLLESDMLQGPHIELFSNTRMVLEGCLGVFEYKDTYLKLKLKKGSLILCGSNFDILLFEGEKITVKGKFSSIEFCVGD